MKNFAAGVVVTLLLLLLVGGAYLVVSDSDGDEADVEALAGAPTAVPEASTAPKASQGPSQTPEPTSQPSMPTATQAPPPAALPPTPAPPLPAAVAASSTARVLSILMSSQVGPDGELIAPTTSFPIGTRQVRAQVRIEGAQPGMRVRSSWYQLGLPDSPPEGFHASSSETVLSGEAISPEGRTRVSFSLTIGGPGLWQETPWVVRIFVNDVPLTEAGFTVVPR